MPTTVNELVETLTQKLEHIELGIEDIRWHLRQFAENRTQMPATTPEQKRAERLAWVCSQKEKQIPVMAEVFNGMGIHGEPIGAEKVQEMIAACGIKPEDNEFSCGITEMREE